MAAPRPESRKARAMSRQVVLALPAWVRRRLGVRPGQVVYFHRHRTGEVVLSMRERRAPGQPGRVDLEADLAAVVTERDQWKAQALAQEHGDYREGYAQGHAAGLHAGLKVGERVDVVLRELAGYAKALDRQLVTTRPRAFRRPPSRRATEVVTIPLLSAPSPSEVEVERGADTSGQPAPGVPLEAEACSERDGAV